jgi:TetR/AcrR family transcriptional regulator, cholesterol catabolism regulator
MQAGVLDQGGQQSPRERILTHARGLFCVHGYHGTSMRDISDAYGTRVAALYNHFRAKEDVLFELLKESTDSLMTALELADGQTCGRPNCRLFAWVRTHARWDIDNREATVMNNHEFRHLPDHLRGPIVESRDRIEARLSELLQVGVKSGGFKIREPKLTVNALFALNRGIADWYSPSGPLTPEQLTTEQALIAMQLVGTTAPRRHSGCAAVSP